MSKMAAHTEHDFDHFTKHGQAVDQNIINRIGDLVREGITSVNEVKKCLKYYIQDVLFAGKEKPDTTCRAFYPTSKDVANHFQEAFRKERCSNLDQENIIRMVSELQAEEKTSKVFRPYCQPDEASGGSCNEDEHVNVENLLAKECQQTLLFSYQSHFMQQLLTQYGNNVTCLDATNRTTDNNLLLFFSS